MNEETTAKIVTAAPSSIAAQRVKKAADLLAQARKDEAALVVQEAATVEEAAAIADHFGAVEKLSSTGVHAENAERDAHFIKQRARRRLGQLTALLPKAPPGRRKKADDENLEKEIGPDDRTYSKREVLNLIGITKQQCSELEKLARIPVEEFDRRVERQREKADRATSPSNVAAASTNIENDAWGTPEPIIADARAVMGRIELDPASNAAANNVVRADRFYTKDDSGLGDVPWNAATVWMNSPFSDPLVAEFQRKFIREFEAGRFEQGITLMNADPSVSWFHELMQRFPVCFPKGRIAFIHPVTGKPVKGNRFPQALFYAGPHVARFAEVFGKYGTILVRYAGGVSA